MLGLFAFVWHTPTVTAVKAVTHRTAGTVQFETVSVMCVRYLEKITSFSVLQEGSGISNCVSALEDSVTAFLKQKTSSISNRCKLRVTQLEV